MKKPADTKLALRIQTIKMLEMKDLAHAVGGSLPPPKGFIMKDSIIVRTGG